MVTIRLLENEVRQLLEQWVQKDNIELSALFDTIFESVTDGIIVYDREGKVVQVNKPLLKIFEVLAVELIGSGDEDLVALFQMSTENGALLAVPQLPSSQILSGHVSTQPKQRDVYLRLRSSRKIVVSISSFPVRNQKKRLLGCISIVHNITERHQKENRVFRAFTSLLTLIDVLAMIPNQNQSLALEKDAAVSPINIAGKSMTEVILQVLGCKFVEVFVLENVEGRQHVIGVSGLSIQEEEVLRGEAEYALISSYLSADKIAQLHANQVVILDLVWQTFETEHSDFGARYRLLTPMVMHGELIGVFVIARVDTEYSTVSVAYSQEEIALAQGIAKLTSLVIERVGILQEWAESRASELAMHEANSRYDAFMSIASHELRTPLTTFKGNAELALRRLDKLTKQGEYDQSFLKAMESIRQPLSYAISRTNLQERMITDLLDSSRIQQTHILKMSMQPFDLLALVLATVADVRLIASDRIVVFQTTEDASFTLCGDADRIGQVVFNYINNALKYSPVEQPIEVCLTRKRGFASVSVHDGGPGIPVESQVKIWERFYQAPDIEVQYESGISGLGLGLYLSRKIIEQHNGRVGLQSILEEGSTFWFDLPLMPTNCL